MQHVINNTKNNKLIRRKKQSILKKYFGYYLYQYFLYTNYFRKIVVHILQFTQINYTLSLTNEITVVRPTIIATINI